MESQLKIAQAERRAEDRGQTSSHISVRRVMPVMPISDATILNVSASGIAIQTAVPLKVGERMSFSTTPNMPPILGEVLGCEATGDNQFRIRCRCLLGNFDVPLDD